MEFILDLGNLFWCPEGANSILLKGSSLCTQANVFEVIMLLIIQYFTVCLSITAQLKTYLILRNTLIHFLAECLRRPSILSCLCINYEIVSLA